MNLNIIDNLEIMPRDIGKMTWNEAVKMAEKLGDEWRLPDKEELMLLYNNRKNIEGLDESAVYWSSTQKGLEVWVFQFQKNYTWEGDYINVSHTCNTRLVRNKK